MLVVFFLRDFLFGLYEINPKEIYCELKKKKKKKEKLIFVIDEGRSLKCLCKSVLNNSWSRSISSLYTTYMWRLS